MSTTVSAVITTYNRASLVGRAIESVLNQTRPVEELIVVDDGSTDNTREVVERYGTRVRYVFQPNRKIACARNRGAEEARSEWVAFLDDDDEWLPEKIEKQVAAVLRDKDAVLCYSGARTIDPAGHTRDIPAPPPDTLWPGLRLKPHFAACTIMVRRDVLLKNGGFRSGLRGAEDWELAVRLGVRHRFTFVPEPLIKVYQATNSLSMHAGRMLDAELSIMDSLLLGLRGSARLTWRLRALSVIFYRAAISARAATGSGLRYLVRSLVYWPRPPLRLGLYKRWRRSFAIACCGAHKFSQPNEHILYDALRRTLSSLTGIPVPRNRTLPPARLAVHSGSFSRPSVGLPALLSFPSTPESPAHRIFRDHRLLFGCRSRSRPGGLCPLDLPAQPLIFLSLQRNDLSHRAFATAKLRFDVSSLLSGDLRHDRLLLGSDTISLSLGLASARGADTWATLGAPYLRIRFSERSE